MVGFGILIPSEGPAAGGAAGARTLAAGLATVACVHREAVLLHPVVLSIPAALTLAWSSLCWLSLLTAALPLPDWQGDRAASLSWTPVVYWRRIYGLRAIG